VIYVIGTATGVDHEFGTKRVDGTTTTELEGNETIVDETTETMTEAGTLDGTDDN